MYYHRPGRWVGREGEQDGPLAYFIHGTISNRDVIWGDGERDEEEIRRKEGVGGKDRKERKE